MSCSHGKGSRGSNSKKNCNLGKKFGGAVTIHYSHGCKKLNTDGRKKKSICRHQRNNPDNKIWKKNFLHLTKTVGKLTEALKKLIKRNKKCKHTSSDSDASDNK